MKERMRKIIENCYYADGKCSEDLIDQLLKLLIDEFTKLKRDPDSFNKCITGISAIKCNMKSVIYNHAIDDILDKLEGKNQDEKISYYIR